ncbi:MAG: PIN domain-containing protein [Akkermansiaceae bacterium]|nr:PIN domain-containing protein [Akkermansiaceae bacterium]
MGSMKAVIDSDILIDYLQGEERSKIELAHYDDLRYSVISWMEIMCRARTPEETEAAEALLRSMTQVDLDMNIARKAVHLRKSLKLKLPDAIILATADKEGCILVTRNTKDFREDDPRVRVPYRY